MWWYWLLAIAGPAALPLLFLRPASWAACAPAVVYAVVWSVGLGLAEVVIRREWTTLPRPRWYDWRVEPGHPDYVDGPRAVYDTCGRRLDGRPDFPICAVCPETGEVVGYECGPDGKFRLDDDGLVATVSEFYPAPLLLTPDA